MTEIQQNPIFGMLDDALADAGAGGAIHEVEEAIREQDRRARLSDLTDGQLDDHELAITNLEESVRGRNYDSPALIADAIAVIREDLQRIREAAQ